MTLVSILRINERSDNHQSSCVNKLSASIEEDFFSTINKKTVMSDLSNQHHEF